MRSRVTPRVVLELAVVGLAGLLMLLPTPPAAVERWFSTGIYPYIQRVVTPVSNVLPFAAFDLLLIAAIVGIVVLFVRARFLTALRVVVVGAAVGYLVFLALWGFNYRRLPMTDRLVLQREAPSSDAVIRLGLEAVQRMNALHQPAHAAGWPEQVWRDPTLREAFAATQQMLATAPLAEPGRLKATLLGQYFRWTSVDGMVNPFALEVLANPDLLPFERPFVAAHEWAHLAGYADESEANFVGWLTCIRASDAAQYSGWLYLFWQVNGEVGADDRRLLWEAMHAGPRADVDAIIARLRRAQLPWLRNAGWAVYDQYLKANRVESGIRSYGAVITLILRARFEDGWVPVRRSSADDRRAP